MTMRPGKAHWTLCASVLTCRASLGATAQGVYSSLTQSHDNDGPALRPAGGPWPPTAEDQGDLEGKADERGSSLLRKHTAARRSLSSSGSGSCSASCYSAFASNSAHPVETTHTPLRGAPRCPTSLTVPSCPSRPPSLPFSLPQANLAKGELRPAHWDPHHPSLPPRVPPWRAHASRPTPHTAQSFQLGRVVRDGPIEVRLVWDVGP